MVSQKFSSASIHTFEGAFEESRHEPGQTAGDISQAIHMHTKKKKTQEKKNNLGLFSIEVGIKRSDIKKDD